MTQELHRRRSISKPRVAHGTLTAAIVAFIALTLLSHALAAAPSPPSPNNKVEGFTEPYRTIRVASPEAGIVTKVLVREGDTVAAGQTLAALDDEVYQSLLAIAKQQMESLGRLNAVTAELTLHTRRMEKLLELRRVGQAYQDEVERARADVEISEAKLLTEREQNKLAKLEYETSRVQLARRAIAAPQAGVIVSLEKHPGEYVSPTSPEIVTLAQLDPLRATFLLTRPQAQRLKVDQTAAVTIVGENAPVRAIVDFVSQVTDAESGMVTVKVRIDNADGRLHSGERCTLDVK